MPSRRGEPVPRTFASWDEYWAVRHDEHLWTPWFRWALELGGVDPAEVSILQPSQYPTARCGDVVVTIYPDAPAVLALELEAHSLVAGCGLPIPGIVASGAFPRSPRGPVWHWLIESPATGRSWNQLHPVLNAQQERQGATDTGRVLRRFHTTPHESGTVLGLDWARFDQLIKDEADQLGHNDGRLQGFPARFQPALHELAAATCATVDAEAPPSLVHGDVHGDNVFLDPTTGQVSAIIDLNEVYAGEPWYDLADACFRLLRGAPGLAEAFLRGYGIDAGAGGNTSMRLLGWGLVHDFDGLSTTIDERGIPAGTEDLEQLADHLTGLAPGT